MNEGISEKLTTPSWLTSPGRNCSSNSTAPISTVPPKMRSNPPPRWSVSSVLPSTSTAKRHVYSVASELALLFLSRAFVGLIKLDRKTASPGNRDWDDARIETSRAEKVISGYVKRRQHPAVFKQLKTGKPTVGIRTQ